MAAWKLGVAIAAGVFLAHAYRAWHEDRIQPWWVLYLLGGGASALGGWLALQLPPLRSVPMPVAIFFAVGALALYRRLLPHIRAGAEHVRRRWREFRHKMFPQSANKLQTPTQ